MENFTSLGLKIIDNSIFYLDQTMLPHEEIWPEAKTLDDMILAIKKLKVRGAPLIGLFAAAYIQKLKEENESKEGITKAIEILRNTRPTAVNLMNCLDRMKNGDHATDLIQEDVELCQKMGNHGAALINDGDNILTHCNTGGLATVGIGTALGVIKTAHDQGKKIHVFVDETRPLLQGGRLTTYELKKLNIPYTLICDNMAATLMHQKKIQKVFLGADRISLSGDFANKIGTYSLAVLCKHHNIPFYTVAPFTTIDPQMNKGEEIEIEQRDPKEVQGFLGKFEWAPLDSKVFNPAFDVTPAELLTGIVFDFGVFTKEELKNGKLKEKVKSLGLL